MPRRYLSSTGSIATLQQKVRSRFHDSPLKEVGLKLERYIVEARAVEDANRRQSESAVVDLVDGYLNVLPSSFGERFFVDGWMIQDICETWERSEIQFSRMIVPQYAGEWGHKA